VNEAIVLLLLLWAVLLLPGALRSRNTSPHTTVGGFERAMAVLRNKPSQGRQLMVPGDAGRIVTHGLSRPARDEAGALVAGGEDPVVSRRRTWFLRLVGGTAGTFLLSLALGGWMWLLFVSLLLVTGGYIALLRHLKLQHDQARRVVRDLEMRRAQQELADMIAAERAPTAGGPEGDVAVGGTVRLRSWDA
jgi:uncharacterized membrane protein